MQSDELVKDGLRRISRATALFGRGFHYPGYTFNELNVLGTIVRHPGMIARDICGYNVIDRGYLSKILKKLEQDGLIVRVTEKRPPFEKFLSAAPRGERVYREAERLVDQNIEERLSVLRGQERASFDDCVSEMVRYLKIIMPDLPERPADAKSGRK